MLYSEAKAHVERWAATSSEPTLSSAEVADCLKSARRYDADGVEPDDHLAWAASMALVVGDTVTPSERNGHYYTVTASDGTAGATEPTWPTTSGATVTADGVTYQESGSESWEPTFDLNYALAEAWDLKEAKAASRNQHIRDSRGEAADYLVLNCRSQAKKYRDRIAGSAPHRTVSLTGRNYYTGRPA